MLVLVCQVITRQKGKIVLDLGHNCFRPWAYFKNLLVIRKKKIWQLLKKMEWRRIPLDCNSLATTSIKFIDSTKSEYDFNNDKGAASFNPERLHANGKQMSPCFQCVLFYYPRLDVGNVDNVHAMYSNLELWHSSNGALYFFRTPVV